MPKALSRKPAETRPWHKSTAQDVRQDPYVLSHYGDFWVALKGVRLLVERAADLLDLAWAKGPNLSEDERGELAVNKRRPGENVQGERMLHLSI